MLVIFSLLHIFFLWDTLRSQTRVLPPSLRTISVFLQLVKTHWTTWTFLECSYQIGSQTFFFLCNLKSQLDVRWIIWRRNTISEALRLQAVPFISMRLNIMPEWCHIIQFACFMLFVLSLMNSVYLGWNLLFTKWHTSSVFNLNANYETITGLPWLIQNPKGWFMAWHLIQARNIWLLCT